MMQVTEYIGLRMRKGMQIFSCVKNNRKIHWIRKYI